MTSIQNMPILFLLVLTLSCIPSPQNLATWQAVDAKGEPTARHEAGLVAFEDKLYLMGGRRINPTSVYDTQSSVWTEKAETPIELHHFQPVVFGEVIYIVGAMTGQWPTEAPVANVIIYSPKKNEYVYSHEIPAHRRRGGAGAVVYKDKIYLVGGITNGHMDGFVPWLDEYDPSTGQWRTLPDAPNARDHFQAVVVQNKLYAFAGRTTSKVTNEDMALTVTHGNIFDFETEQWNPVSDAHVIPTLRAGNSAFAWNGSVVIGGGESMQQVAAHNEVEAFNTRSGKWLAWPSFLEGRHGTGFAVVGDYVYTVSGSGKRGGEPELISLERLYLPSIEGE